MLTERAAKARPAPRSAGDGLPQDLTSCSFNVGFWTWSAAADVFRASPRARFVLGLDPEAPLSVRQALGAVHAADRRRLLKALIRSRDVDHAVELLLRLNQRTDQRTDAARWIDVHARIQRDPDGAVQEISGHIADVTERKRADSELQLLRQQLTHLSRIATLGEYSGAIVHELQQPLTAVRCNALAAKRWLDANGQSEAEMREIIHDVLASENRAQEIIQRMRPLLKRRPTQFRRVEVGAVLREVATLAGSSLHARGVALSIRIDPQARAVRGDSLELEQVLLNLLLNASQAMRANAPGERHVEIAAAPEQEGRMIRFSVSDTGTGIAPQHLDRIFDPFFSTKDDGVGLGLAICRNIVASHQGGIWAANNPDRGARFEFTVPVMRDPPT